MQLCGYNMPGRMQGAHGLTPNKIMLLATLKNPSRNRGALRSPLQQFTDNDTAGVSPRQTAENQSAAGLQSSHSNAKKNQGQTSTLLLQGQDAAAVHGLHLLPLVTPQ